jgi:hypothetical protein
MQKLRHTGWRRQHKLHKPATDRSKIFSSVQHLYTMSVFILVRQTENKNTLQGRINNQNHDSKIKCKRSCS